VIDVYKTDRQARRPLSLRRAHSILVTSHPPLSVRRNTELSRG